jgi:Subtilase family
MKSARSARSRSARRSSLAVLLFVCALAPASASAMSESASEPNLSSRLAELATPTLRSASPAAQAARLSLASSGPGSLLRDGNRVLVDVQLEAEPALTLAALRQAGAEIVESSDRYRTVTVAARPADLRRIDEVSGVAAVNEVLTPIVRGADCGGAVRSEGDVQLGAASARAAFGVDGSGVTVGILSDSFDRDPTTATRATGDVASGDLPGPGSPCGSGAPVGVLDDSDAEGADEGRAMAQIVHDLAPGATLDFATAFSGELGFAAAIRGLAANGADVIADDVAYFEEPFFQDGPVAVAVNQVVGAGVSYFSAAGNDNLIDQSGRDIASWEAPAFRDSATCPAALLALGGFGSGHCMDFDPVAGPPDDTFGITVAKGATLTVDLQWAQPWNGVTTDLDAYLLDAGGKVLKVEGTPVAATDNNITSRRPVEVLQWENETGAAAKVQLAIDDCSGAPCNPGADGGLPRLKFALLENGAGVTATEYPESDGGDTVGPTVFGHAGSASAIAVGAVPYDESASAEPYSSRGPVTHYFSPVESEAPAPAIAPQTIPKPDLAATDCGVTTFFANFAAAEGVWRFCGTSAAAPHAAAVAALLREASPGAGATQIRERLIATARPVGAFGPDAVGAGLLDARAALGSLAPPPTIAIVRAPPALSRDSRPVVEFTASRPVAFSCRLDGGAPQPCASPFSVPAPLADGSHAIVVSGMDLTAQEGRAATPTFVVDTQAPGTTFAKHPPKRVRSHRHRARVVFRFRTDEAGPSFVCKVDRGPSQVCAPRLSRRFAPGRHLVRVRAQDAAGNVDPTPAVFRFRVERIG